MAIRLLRGPSGADAVLDLAIGPALLANMVTAGGAEWLRVYRPRPTVAFTARDRLLPGFGAAVEAARDHGFTPVRRSSGGRAAAYSGQALCLDHVGRERTELADITGRFAAFAALLAGCLIGLGVDARVGEVDGEYCPGEFSVNGAGRIKLVGTAQRMTRRCWLFSTVIVVSDTAAVRAVLTDVYAALELSWNPQTAGAVTDLVPGITLDEVESAVLDAYRTLDSLIETDWPAEVLVDGEHRGQDHRL